MVKKQALIKFSYLFIYLPLCRVHYTITDPRLVCETACGNIGFLSWCPYVHTVS